MDELSKEVKKMKTQIRNWIVTYLCTVIIFALALIVFQTQHSRIISYYQSTLDQVQDVLFEQKVLNSYLEDIKSMIEDYRSSVQ